MIPGLHFCLQTDDIISFHPGIIIQNPELLLSLTYRADMLPGTFSQLELQICYDMGLPSVV